MSQYAGPVPSQPDHTWALPSAVPSATADGRGAGLAILSLLLSLLALLGVLGVGAWMFVSGIPLPGETTSPLTGRLPAVPTNRTLPGVRLAAAVSATLRDRGEEVSNLTCPDISRVAEGVITVCHGSSSGDPWSVVVVFENRDGQFTLLTA
jgi:hypothetical protein